MRLQGNFCLLNHVHVASQQAQLFGVSCEYLGGEAATNWRGEWHFLAVRVCLGGGGGGGWVGGSWAGDLNFPFPVP